MGKGERRLKLPERRKDKVVCSPPCTSKRKGTRERKQEIKPNFITATSEYEILRGDMARIVYGLTKSIPNITYVFDEMATEIKQDESKDGKALVTFKNGKLPPTEFDIVIGADGQMSRTRRMVFGHGPNNDDYLYRLGQYSALFTMPRESTDTQYAQWYNASRGRLFLLRPDQYGTIRAYLAVTDANLSRFDEVDKLLKKGTREEQQAWFEKEFEGAGWQTERCIREMKKADDFYMQQIAQVKMDTWHKGRVALVGDAAYCPSPISGVVSSPILDSWHQSFILMRVT
jgi:2-polyprenyl-6-methoxyphenol hydroxylase-like FAD-dependent oxidoreductase